MAIDNGVANGGGDTVTIDATNASDDDAVFTCVPGIIINDPDGVRIQFLELYSAPGQREPAGRRRRPDREDGRRPGQRVQVGVIRTCAAGTRTESRRTLVG